MNFGFFNLKKMKILKKLTFFIILFQTIVNINCQYVPMGRSLHTATLIGTKIFFFGGATGTINGVLQPSGDFFYLDLSNSFDKTTGTLPFVDLSDKALEVPTHFGAAATAFGEPKDSIFLFGGDMGKFNDVQTKLIYLFNSSQLEWEFLVNVKGNKPEREMVLNAVTDNNNKIYVFGGGFNHEFGIGQTSYVYSGEMNIFDPINHSWSSGEGGRIGRDGHTATFLPDTGEIIYIGGINAGTGLIDIANLEIYDTTSDTWRIQMTVNPPEPRYGHTAVLKNCYIRWSSICYRTASEDSLCSLRYKVI
ncbi:hypothetical protein C1645_877727 [Glomus cerebriforme]|uniref:Galactose oxidase n=1 Tax=Glomus cerebriforme TaxID=658196 RepID=A0A397SV83_9GLOM|nr:hypothetical protein C1645_877727 [Glomus cerebriforme]